jgi:hypothetical protein
LGFVLAFLGTLVVALVQGPKMFFYDSGEYWTLAKTFTQHGHVSLLNFESPLRGYALPLIYEGLKTIGSALSWSQSVLAKLSNVLAFALIGAVLVPRLAEMAWPAHRWGIVRRLALTALLVIFWSGYLNFPLSDFPGLALALVALVAIAHPDRPGWMLLAGVASGVALDMRPAYLLLAPIIIILVVWAWLEQRGAQHASVATRALCIVLLVGGFAAVSLPQSLASHRHYGTWSFIPGAAAHLSDIQLTDGLLYQRFTTYIGPGKPNPAMLYVDPAGQRLLRHEKGDEITSFGQYLGLIVAHPITMSGVLGRDLINGLDQRYTTPYIEHLDTGSHRWLRLANFLILFLALVRVLWPSARRSLGPAKWRYPVAFLLCCLTSVPSQMENRYLLPVYLLSYTLLLMPDWPNPYEASEVGLARFRTPLLLAAACLVFMAVFILVTAQTSKHLQFGADHAYADQLDTADEQDHHDQRRIAFGAAEGSTTLSTISTTAKSAAPAVVISASQPIRSSGV